MPEYGEVYSQVLQDVVLRVDRAFQAFFRRVMTGETPGYPRVQGRYGTRFTSFTYPQVGAHGGARLENGCLVLSKIDRIALRWSRSMEGTPQTATISREADGWYVCFSCAGVPRQPLAPTGQETGIDLGIESFATLADGTMMHTPRCYRTAERRVKTAQRKVSRRKQGSKRRQKAVKSLAKAHLTVNRQRTDFQHKAAVQLVREYDALSHEDLPTANLLTNSHLAKSIADAGWSHFLSILHAKAAWAGRGVVAVPPAYCLHQPDLLWLWRCGHEGALRPLAQLPGLWHQPASGPERREAYREAWAKPSGTRGVGRGGELSIPRLQPWGVSSQESVVGQTVQA